MSPKPMNPPYSFFFPPYGVAPSSGDMATSGLPVVPEEQHEVPFYIEPFEAYRCWSVEIDRDQPVLRSMTYRIRWPKKKPMIAHCLQAWHQTTPPHTSPDTRHKCGIYSVKNQDGLKSWTGMKKNVVLGVILLWGKVFEYEKGYLSEYAYPQQFIGYAGTWDLDPLEVIPLLQDSYGVEANL